MTDIKLYTVEQLRNWLEHNQAAEGLSEQIIAPSRDGHWCDGWL